MDTAHEYQTKSN